jgi:glutamine amidotransferase
VPVRITIADYGVGNLHSIRKALENCGAEVSIASDLNLLLDAECIVLPGVGAFSRTMERLLSIKDEIVRRLNEGTPCLGICIGMQILFEGSEEGSRPGLGFMKGRVIKLKANKIPHMGWNTVAGEDSILHGIDSKFFYFAHSYRGDPQENIIVGRTHYGEEFPSIVRKRNTYGTQFHPEKSSTYGLKFLLNFVEFAEGCL